SENQPDPHEPDRTLGARSAQQRSCAAFSEGAHRRAPVVFRAPPSRRRRGCRLRAIGARRRRPQCIVHASPTRLWLRPRGAARRGRTRAMVAQDLLQRAQAWLKHDPDPTTRAELSALIEGDEGELAERFAGPLTFGTAG